MILLMKMRKIMKARKITGKEENSLKCIILPQQLNKIWNIRVVWTSNFHHRAHSTNTLPSHYLLYQLTPILLRLLTGDLNLSIQVWNTLDEL